MKKSAAVFFCICGVAFGGTAQAQSVALYENDTDQDGLPDLWEQSVFHTDPMRTDTDQDGYMDRREIENGYNPLVKGSVFLRAADKDADGLSDQRELLFGTDPLVADTDQDGVNDGAEVYNGFSPTSTSAIALKKSLVIRITTQRLEQRINGIAVADYPVSTGMKKMPTPLGTYRILNKNPKAWSRVGKLWMPYWMHFSGKGHGIHELPVWPGGKREGAWHLGTPVSHGCVRLGIGPAKKVYEWAPVGTPVRVIK